MLVKIYTDIRRDLKLASDETRRLLTKKSSSMKDEREYTIARVCGLYRLGYDRESIARYVKLSPGEVQNILNAYTQRLTKHVKKRRGARIRLDIWQHMHPDIELTESLKDAMALTGLDRSQILYGLRCRRDRFRKWASKLKEIRNEKLFFLTSSGKRVYHKAVKEARFFYNPYKNRTVLEILTYQGDIFSVPISNRWLFSAEWRKRKSKEEKGEERVEENNQGNQDNQDKPVLSDESCS